MGKGFVVGILCVMVIVRWVFDLRGSYGCCDDDWGGVRVGSSRGDEVRVGWGVCIGE